MTSDIFLLFTFIYLFFCLMDKLDPSSTYKMVDVVEHNNKLYSMMESTTNSTDVCLYKIDFIESQERYINTKKFDEDYMNTHKTRDYYLLNKKGICTVFHMF